MTFCKVNIRAPTITQLLQWAKNLGVSKKEALLLSDQLPYRHALGNRITPPSYTNHLLS